nr:gamma-glutamyl-gamma-aminobutyrate hydrolase family protein [Kineosphaera limosa]
MPAAPPAGEAADGSRPLIGLTSYDEPVDRPLWPGQRCVFVPQDYVAAIEAAGGVPVLLAPNVELTEQAARHLLSRLDGLLVTGGADLDPATYGQAAHAATGPPHPGRDHADLMLVRAARWMRLPLLGVCRGLQVMAVEAGGALEQHLPDRVGHERHCPTPGAFGREQVDLVPGTRLADLLGPRLDVECHHHQAVTEHPGYDLAARAADGTIEAVEDPRARFAVGVQWHPEAGTDPRLFRALVVAAAERAQRRDWAPPAAGGPLAPPHGPGAAGGARQSALTPPPPPAPAGLLPAGAAPSRTGSDAAVAPWEEPDPRLPPVPGRLVALGMLAALLGAVAFGAPAGFLGYFLAGPAGLAWLLVGAGVGMFVGAWFVGRRRGWGLAQWGFVRARRSLWGLTWQLPLMMLSSLLLTAVFGTLLGLSPQESDDVTQEVLAVGGPALVLPTVLAVAVVVPFAEEMLFRRLLLDWLRSRMPVLAAGALATVVFAAVHVAPQAVLYILFLGAWLAFLRVHYASLWAPLILHAVNNAMVAGVALWALTAGL